MRLVPPCCLDGSQEVPSASRCADRTDRALEGLCSGAIFQSAIAAQIEPDLHLGLFSHVRFEAHAVVPVLWQLEVV